MGLFKKDAISEPAIKGAAAATRYPYSQNVIGNFVYYTQNLPRDAAMQVPTISRARDLICSMVGCLTFKQYSLQWDGEELERIYIPPDVWMQQPDPNVTRNFILSWTTEDLIMQGRAFWVVTERLGNGFPSKFTWIPAGDVNTLDQSTGQWFGPSKQIYFQGVELNPNDVVQFLSPIQGLVYTGVRAINTANRLQNAAERFASQTIPAGYLKQTGGEPMTSQELADMAASFAAAREEQTIAALNEFVEYVPNTANPDDLQLTDARTFQSLEMARLANIPPFLVGAPTGGGMNYQNSAESNKLLYLYGSKPYIECIEQTLSMNNVLPRGRYVELDVSTYLYENDLAGGEDDNAASASSPAITIERERI